MSAKPVRCGIFTPQELAEISEEFCRSAATEESLKTVKCAPRRCFKIGTVCGIQESAGYRHK